MTSHLHSQMWLELHTTEVLSWGCVDSLTVIKWLGDWDRHFSSYENFRIKKIRMLTPLHEWRYVPSKSNPADVASKGLNADDSKGRQFFHHGPPFLLQPKEDWPTAPEAAPLKVAPRPVGKVLTTVRLTNPTSPTNPTCTVRPVTVRHVQSDKSV